MENELHAKIRFFIAGLKRSLFSKRYLYFIIITFLISVFSINLLNAINQATIFLSPEMLEVFKIGKAYNIGILSVSNLNLSETKNYDEIIVGILSGSFLISIVASFVSLYICSEFKNGYFVIALTHGQSRISLINQYMCLSAISCLPILLISIIGVITSMMMNHLFAIKNSGYVIRTLILQIFLILICSVCFSCVSLLFEKYKAVIICISSVLILPLIPRYMSIFFRGKVNIEKYMLLSMIINSQSITNSEILNCIITAIFTGLLFYLTTFAILRKKRYE